MNPSEQVDRVYRIVKIRRLLPAQKKHNTCNAKYAAEKTGLEEVSGVPVESPSPSISWADRLRGLLPGRKKGG